MNSMQEFIEKSKKHAEENGFQLNPNEAVVNGLVTQMIKREEEFGEKYCPCRRITGDVEEDKKIICPCVYHKDEVQNDGHCHCFLFTK
jgi:ferredoxin-thioredoxin reductase catalytic chain